MRLSIGVRDWGPPLGPGNGVLQYESRIHL